MSFVGDLRGFGVGEGLGGPQAVLPSWLRLEKSKYIFEFLKGMFVQGCSLRCRSRSQVGDLLVIGA